MVKTAEKQTKKHLSSPKPPATSTHHPIPLSFPPPPSPSPLPGLAPLLPLSKTPTQRNHPIQLTPSKLSGLPLASKYLSKLVLLMSKPS